MKKKSRAKNSHPKTTLVAAGSANSVECLLASLRAVIQESRQQALRAVDIIQVHTCWLVGRHIVEFEQGGQARAAYGKGVLAQVSAQLTAEFGRGYDASNLYKMSQFYRVFPNLDALRLNLSWTHYRLLLRVDSASARDWYMNEAATQNWNTRARTSDRYTLL
ncbi:MAG UNVERIFIED_CONTAM: DUF1016 N-terminal domain-containing protein [Planctomycetaceae bacterium]|jgi:hypothetical protein